jgi:hypothetical protein
MMTRNEFKSLTNDEKSEAKRKLWEIVKSSVTDKPEAVEALKVLRPSLYGVSIGRSAGPAKYTLFANMFNKVGDEVDELSLFKELKVGRKEANSLIKDNIKKVTPEERKWISFDPESESYILKAKGPTPPKDWTGYEPVEEVLDEYEDEDLI